MKFTPFFVAIALGAASFAGPSFATPNYASPHKVAKIHSAVEFVAHRKDTRTKVRKPEQPRCFAWPGGCTGTPGS